jgi:cytochrome P450
MKQIHTRAVAKFMFGPKNPLDSAKSQKAFIADFWTFDSGFIPLLIGIVPYLIARKVVQARERLVQEFLRFVQSGNEKLASKVVQKRSEIGRRNGFDNDGIARSDLSFFFAGIVNTSITSFWLSLRIFADLELLDEIRHEITQICHISQDTNNTTGDTIISIEGDMLKDRCPLLVSAFRETLRLASDSLSTRVVLEDTIIADEYFLKKGSVVQIAAAAIHNDARIWGPDVESFNARRFLDFQLKKSNSAAFRAFGGGSTICPGRYLATTEVLVFTATMIMMFDLEPINVKEDGRDGGSQSGLRIPFKNDRKLPVHVCEPVQDVRVGLRSRRVQVNVL